MKITFTNSLQLSDYVIASPQPASQLVPEWYKKAPSYISGKKEPARDDFRTANQTVKRCMPVFDAMTAGYIITTPCDIWVEMRDNIPFFIWTDFNVIEWHPITQTVGHPATKDNLASPKFMNPWIIETPAGYSSLFITPSHQDIPFDIMPGVVDTDTYKAPINFPFALKENFTGLIPAGTPMVQIIPFERKSWQMQIGGDKQIQEMRTILNKMQTVFWDRYKRFWWHKKEYR